MIAFMNAREMKVVQSPGFAKPIGLLVWGTQSAIRLSDGDRDFGIWSEYTAKRH